MVADAFLGLNILHDTAAALVVDGELVAAVEQERFNRDRHTTHFPKDAVDYCLETAGLRRTDLRGIAVTFDYDEFRTNDKPFERHTNNHDDTTVDGRARIVADNRSTWESARRQLDEFGFPNVRYLRHHLTHAACGYYLSNFSEAGVIVVDGRGEREATTLWHAQGRKINNLESYDVDDSLGQLYTYVTSLCGLYGNIGNEGKTMGLSGYGSDRFDFRSVLTFDADRYRINRDEMRKFAQYRAPLGQPDENASDLAYAVQAKLEEVFRFLAARVRSLTGCRDLVLSGGVALNCNANGMLVASEEVSDLFVPPAANDAGTAVGAALLQWAEFSGQRPSTPANQTYLGERANRSAIDRAVASSGVSSAKVQRPEVVAARAIASGLIIGWYQGRMEFGPRALGNRSILADPRDPNMPDKLNNRVKFRESWRPFAPSALAEFASAWFTPAVDSPYMLLSLEVLPERRHLVPAITHVDGSSRVQTVERDHNPLYHGLIEEFHRLTGVPMVVNTSLNIRGEPIARTPEDAVQCLVESGLDLVILGDTVAWKTGVEVESLLADEQ